MLIPLALAGSSHAGEGDLDAAYREIAERILAAAEMDAKGWEDLTYLTTVIGHRLSGSEGLEKAVAWSAGRMAADGLDNVSRQPVQVRHWVRGEESAEVVSPSPRPLAILGLGGSVATPAGGITAPVVVVDSFDHMEELGRAAVEGKIVVYAVPWEGYGKTVRYRGRGASRAAALGAVAVLVRSATGRSIASPHTGAMGYDEDHPEIPAASITVEDSEWFRRMTELGLQVTVRLRMQPRELPEATSANVIGEITGSERPEEIVVMGGHLDSWDVGQGAHDDGAGCVAAWRAVSLLEELGLRPRRTLRVVLWTNEENGLGGAKAYREALGDEVGNHVAAIEMDGGAELPVGFGFGIVGIDPESDDSVYEAAYARLEKIGRLLEGIDAAEIRRGGGGADIGPLMRGGVPGLNLRTVGEHYFDWHHTEADTLDKVEPENLRRAIGALAVMGYILADMPERLVPAP
jgi:Zn-dependent M28 family amino/carboxypeptidase